MTTGNSKSLVASKTSPTLLASRDWTVGIFSCCKRSCRYFVFWVACMTGNDNPKTVGAPLPISFRISAPNRVAVDPPTDATIAVICSSLII